MKNKISFTLFALAAIALLLSSPASAQERRERTIDEVKTEAIHRAEVGQYP